jgi:hypothetical protein
MAQLILKESKTWLRGNRVSIEIKEDKDPLYRDIRFGQIKLLFRLIKRFYELSLGGVDVLKTLYESLEERLSKEEELASIYACFNSPGHKHIDDEEFNRLEDRIKVLKTKLGRPPLFISTGE